MRLICPNCDAQYEVDDSVIPADGRDVQCSSCGNTWFQPGAGMELVEDDAVFVQDPEPQPEVRIEPDPEPAYDDDEDPETQDQDVPPPQRRPLDDSVLDVLRQEAERESAARRAEGSAGLESQPDLGLEGGGSAPIAPGPRERVARLRAAAEENTDTVSPSAETGSRRDLLPDIEEINSTLRATSDRQEAEGDAPVLENDPLPRKRGQFGLGFGTIVVLGALAAALYLLAPKIAMMVPQAQPVLASYVEWVNAVRVGVNGAVSSAAESATGFLTSLAK